MGSARSIVRKVRRITRRMDFSYAPASVNPRNYAKTGSLKSKENRSYRAKQLRNFRKSVKK